MAFKRSGVRLPLAPPVSWTAEQALKIVERLGRKGALFKKLYASRR